MRVVQLPAVLKARETERNMQNLHTLEHRLIWLYTWRQQAKQGENPQKYGAHAPQLHPIWPQAATGAMRQHLFPLSIKDGEGARG